MLSILSSFFVRYVGISAKNERQKRDSMLYKNYKGLTKNIYLLLTFQSCPIDVIESSAIPMLINIALYGTKPKRVAKKNIENGTPTIAELALRNQFGTTGVNLRKRK